MGLINFADVRFMSITELHSEIELQTLGLTLQASGIYCHYPEFIQVIVILLFLKRRGRL